MIIKLYSSMREKIDAAAVARKIKSLNVPDRRIWEDTRAKY